MLILSRRVLIEIFFRTKQSINIGGNIVYKFY